MKYISSSDPCSHILTSPLINPTSPPINISDTSLPPLPMPSSNLDPMMSSVYGSLDTDTDLRTQDFVTSTTTIQGAEGPGPSSIDEDLESDIRTQRSHALSSFYSTLGARGASTSPIGSPSKDSLFPTRSMSEDATSERKSSMARKSSPRPASVSLSEGSFKRRYKSGDAVASSSASGRICKEDSIASVHTDPGDHICLLDVIMIDFSDIDLFSAQWKPKDDSSETQEGAAKDLVFPSYIIRRESGKLLKEKTRLSVQAERNLEGDLSHAVPDILIDAKLSSVQVSLDVEQFKLVKGLLAHNFAEPLEQFQTKLINFEDPKIQVCFSHLILPIFR